MERKRRIFGLALLLSVLLGIPLVLGLGIVDVSRLSSGLSSPVMESNSTAVFVDPEAVIDETFQSGSLIWFHVNVSDVTDLYAWQLNLSWNPSVLNISDVVAGEFLLRTDSVNKTAAFQLGYVVNSTNYVKGYTCISESILGDVGGIPEPDNGRLASIEFEVVGYGYTDLHITATGSFPTTMLDSAGGTITPMKADGYFSNKIWGDVDGDGDVDGFDLTRLCGTYGSTPGDPTWDMLCDIDRNGVIDGFDLTPAFGNYGETV